MAVRPSVSLVLPVFDGAAFLERALREALAWMDGDGTREELVVVDDGSRDATPRILQRVAEADARVRVLTNPVNRGKGYSVRRGVSAARGSHRVFTDADLTYTMSSVDAIVQALRDGAELAVGCRVHPESRYVVAPSFFRYIYTRHNAGRVFNALVRATVVPQLRDTQAGIKGFAAHVVDELFPRLVKDRFSFDVEMLYLAQREGYRIAEVPVTYFYRKEASTVRFARDTVEMCRDLLDIRVNGVRGVYEERPSRPRDEVPEAGRAAEPPDLVD